MSSKRSKAQRSGHPPRVAARRAPAPQDLYLLGGGENRVVESVPPQISICILAGHGIEQLDACLASLRGQDDAPAFAVLIGGNPSTAAQAVVHRHFPTARVSDTGTLLPGAARNPLIEQACGELLLFLDDDVTAPPTLLRRLADLAASHPEASVFGGPNATPPGSSRFQVVQGIVLGSLAGSGPVSRRYGARHPGFADERWFTLCNLAVRRRVMVPFLDELVCAEENELLAKLRGQGKLMLYEPTLRVFHARRPTWGSFARQMLKYGRGRGQLLAWRPTTFRGAYLAPAALLGYVVVLAVLFAVFGSGLSVVAWAPLALYGLILTATAARIAWVLRMPSAVPLVAPLLVTIHLCYGIGTIRGLMVLSTWRSRSERRRKQGFPVWGPPVRRPRRPPAPRDDAA